jgi:hypothetical protein
MATTAGTRGYGAEIAWFYAFLRGNSGGVEGDKNFGSAESVTRWEGF